MSNYLYFLHEEQGLNNRFNVENRSGEGYSIVGLNDWRELISLLLELIFSEQNEQAIARRQDIKINTVNELTEITNSNFNIYEQQDLLANRSTEELVATLLLIRLRRFPALPKNKCPRLFVSHRRDDVKFALRIAKLAEESGFAYWVDVLDPDLRMLQQKGVPEKLLPLITACIIEFALINCTHVIACLTGEWRGSMWIPYEYGRIKELPTLNVNACAWIHPNLTKTDFPEYMLLGEISLNEKQIASWLETEYKFTNKNFCHLEKEDTKVFDGIEELPELSDLEIENKQKEFDQWLREGMPLKEDIIAPKTVTFKKSPK
jgi:hypothetical protein